MPKGWIVVSTAPKDHNPSPRTAAGVPTDPAAFHKYVLDVLAKTKPKVTLEGLYFEVGAERAHLIVSNLDDYFQAKAVTRILGATSYTKLLDARGAKRALGLERGLRPVSPPPRKPPSKPRKPPVRRRPPGRTT